MVTTIARVRNRHGFQTRQMVMVRVRMRMRIRVTFRAKMICRGGKNAYTQTNTKVKRHLTPTLPLLLPLPPPLPLHPLTLTSA